MTPTIKRLPKAIKPYLEATTIRSADTNINISKKAVGYFVYMGCTFIIWKAYKYYEVIEFRTGAKTAFSTATTSKEALTVTVNKLEKESKGKPSYIRSIVGRYVKLYGYALQAKYSNLLKAN